MAKESAVPNLVDLARNDEGMKVLGATLQELLAGGVRALTVDTVGAPVDAVGMAMNSLGVPVGDRPVGGSKWLREAFGQPVEDSPTALAGNLASAALSPAKASLDIMQLAPLLLGAIRKGGRSDLAMIHNMNPDRGDFERWWQSTQPMTNPSLAISKTDNPYPFAEAPTLVFNPQAHQLDPASNPNVYLYNRDAYTDRSKSYYYADKDKRMGLEDVRLTEGHNPGLVQRLSIEASPRFKSFSEYEKKKGGADLLDKGFRQSQTDDIIDHLKTWVDLATDGAHRARDLSPESIQGLLNTVLKKHPEQYSSEAVEYARIIQTALREQVGSNYAELKHWGQLPLDGRTVSGLLLPGGWDDMPGMTAKLRKGADKRGIPHGTVAELLPEGIRDNITEDAELIARERSKLISNHSYEGDADLTKRLADTYGVEASEAAMMPWMDADNLATFLAEAPKLRDKAMQWLSRFKE